MHVVRTSAIASVSNAKYILLWLSQRFAADRKLYEGKTSPEHFLEGGSEGGRPDGYGTSVAKSFVIRDSPIRV